MMWILTWLLCAPAWSASRIVVTTSEPVQLFVDGMLIPTSIGNVRSVIPHVSPGELNLAIRDLRGAKLHEERLTIPDRADVRVSWTRGQSFVVSGADPRPVEAAAPMAVSPPVAVQTTAASSAPSARSTSGTDAVRRTASRAPSVGQVTNVVTGSGVAGLAAGAAASGVRALTYGAKAGTNFGAPTVAPQRIVKPDVQYARVRLIKAGGVALVIYEDGMLVARLAAGTTRLDIQLEVGRRTLEVRSADSNQVLFVGDLTVDPSHVVQLSVSDAAHPKPAQRPWLYKAH